jgi:hypothetical protein
MENLNFPSIWISNYFGDAAKNSLQNLPNSTEWKNDVISLKVFYFLNTNNRGTSVKRENTAHF